MRGGFIGLLFTMAALAAACSPKLGTDPWAKNQLLANTHVAILTSVFVMSLLGMAFDRKTWWAPVAIAAIGLYGWWAAFPLGSADCGNMGPIITLNCLIGGVVTWVLQILARLVARMPSEKSMAPTMY